MNSVFFFFINIQKFQASPGYVINCYVKRLKNNRKSTHISIEKQTTDMAESSKMNKEAQLTCVD